MVKRKTITLSGDLLTITQGHSEDQGPLSMAKEMMTRREESPHGKASKVSPLAEQIHESRHGLHEG
jgi:hypothetical protein